MGQIKNIKLHIVTDIKVLTLTIKLKHHGSCPHQDSEESSTRHNREVLYATNTRLSHQQTHLRRGDHHPKQEAPQQDRRVYHSSHEENRTGTCERNLRETSRRGARAERQLRPRDISVGTGSY